MYYTVYKVTNKINNKFYIGKHQTETPDDDYLGSGALIIKAVQKYGEENFVKEILHVFESEKEMNEMERSLLDERTISDPNCYNIAYGGNGGCIVLKSGHPLYDQTRQKISDRAKERMDLMSSEEKKRVFGVGGMTGKTHSQETRNKMKSAQVGIKERPWLKERIVSEETKQKLSRVLKGRPKSAAHKASISKNHHDVSGDKNPMFGKRHSEETLEKISLKAKQRQRHECPFCNKWVGPNNFKRWHGDKCKSA